MADVFISYASEDRDRIVPLARALEARGFSVWWDRALAAGDHYAQVIERELEAARVVIVVWTQASVRSTFVRDEAGRARDTGRLVPVMLDPGLTLPLGFASIQAEDFSGWNGGAGDPQVRFLEEVIRARLSGRPVDAAKLDKGRRKLSRRVRLVSILALVALLLVSAASLYVIFGRSSPVESARSAQLERLLELVAQGKLTGAQALELSKLLEEDAFASADDSATAERAPAGASVDAERQAPAVSQSEMVKVARASYSDAVATLLQSPDPAVRAAVVLASSRETRDRGLQALWDISKSDTTSNASALWRATGSLMLAANDPRAVEALEQAREANPHDKSVWRMLSFGYTRAQKPREAASAALVGEGLEASSARDWSKASASLDRALDYSDNPKTRGFILGQMGDAAVANEDLPLAEQRYSEALKAHSVEKDTAALSLDSAKLARTQLRRGDTATACVTLRNARAEGASVPDEELRSACARDDGKAPAPAIIRQKTAPQRLQVEPVERKK